MTPTGNKIKVWNSLNGEILKIFSDITKGDITVFTLDDLKRRCFIGDSLGEVNVYNVLNGAKIKPITKHNAEITFII